MTENPEKRRSGPVVEWTDGIPRMDLRGLQPPQPAVAILKFLEGEDSREELLVRLDREPLFLYPELVERGWNWSLLSDSPGDVALRIFR